MTRAMGKQLRDQSAHFGASLIVALLVTTGPVAGTVIGFALWLVREFTEWQAAPNRSRWPWAGPGSVLSRGSCLDLIFWTLGGAAAGAIGRIF